RKIAHAVDRLGDDDFTAGGTSDGWPPHRGKAERPSRLQKSPPVHGILAVAFALAHPIIAARLCAAKLPATTPSHTSPRPRSRGPAPPPTPARYRRSGRHRGWRGRGRAGRR